VFGDSPVVFCNTYYRNVTTRGVLGYQTPGLQVFFPLDAQIALLLIDDQVYGGKYRDDVVLDIHERSDVSQLNALQLHHSLNAVYFADASDADYVLALWHAHKPTIIQPQARFLKRTDLQVMGESPQGQVVFHGFEPHLNIKLDLSFVRCEPIAAKDYHFRRRC